MFQPHRRTCVGLSATIAGHVWLFEPQLQNVCVAVSATLGITYANRATPAVLPCQRAVSTAYCALIGSCLGRRLAYGGSLIRPEATGYGLVYFADEVLQDAGDTFKVRGSIPGPALNGQPVDFL